MKRLSGTVRLPSKVIVHRPSQYTIVRLVSGAIGACLIVAAIPLFSVGSASDIHLQVPVSETISDSAFVPASADMEELSGRENVNLLTLPSDILSATTDSISVEADTLSQDLTSVDSIVESNTYAVKESQTADGIPIEMLDVSSFTPDNTTIYIGSNGVNVRSTPSSDGQLLATLTYANHATRIGIGSSWSQITLVDGTTGFVLTSLITTEFVATPTPTATPTPSPTPKPSYTESAASGTYYAIGEINVRSGPGTGYSLVKTLPAGSGIDVTAVTSNGWYKTVRGTYVRTDLVTASTSTSTNTSASTSTSATPVDPSGTDFVTYCLSFLGVPYVSTGMSPSGFDCSGFTSYVFSHYYNISLPHASYSIATMGTAVSADQVQVGDVVCYDYTGDGTVDHVAVYIGGGAIVHASSSHHKIVQGVLCLDSVTTIRRFL